MIEQDRAIDPQDHRALFRQIVEDRRAGQISADYPAWLHLMARLLGVEIRVGRAVQLRYIAGRVNVSVATTLMYYGWEVLITLEAPRNLVYPPEPPVFDASVPEFGESANDSFVNRMHVYAESMRFREGELDAYLKWRDVEAICREICGDCEANRNECDGDEPGCVRVESSIHWRSGRG